MAPRPETLTCCLSQAGIASAPLKANEVERVKSELRQRAKASSRAADSVSVDEVLHVLRPLVELLKQTAPDFTSAQVSSRQSFWRNAAEVTLGRAEGAAIFKRLLKDPGVIAAVAWHLLPCLVLESGLETPLVFFLTDTHAHTQDAKAAFCNGGMCCKELCVGMLPGFQNTSCIVNLYNYY